MIYGNRLKALENNEKSYNGSPCKNCGTTLKHAINASCVLCSRERNRLQAIKVRQFVRDVKNRAGGK